MSANQTVQQILEYDRLNLSLLKIQKQLAETEAFKNYENANKLLQKIAALFNAENTEAGELMEPFVNYEKQLDALTLAFREICDTMEECVDEKELNYLLKKLSDLNKTLDYLIKSVQKAASEAAKLSKDFAENMEKYKQYVAARNASQAQFNEIKKSMDAEIREIQAKIKALVETMDKDIVQSYDNLRKSKIRPMISPYEKRGREPGTCKGCGMQVDITTDLKINNEGWVYCQNCGRILYLEQKK